MGDDPRNMHLPRNMDVARYVYQPAKYQEKSAGAYGSGALGGAILGAITELATKNEAAGYIAAAVGGELGVVSSFTGIENVFDAISLKRKLGLWDIDVPNLAVGMAGHFAIKQVGPRAF